MQGFSQAFKDRWNTKQTDKNTLEEVERYKKKGRRKRFVKYTET